MLRIYIVVFSLGLVLATPARAQFELDVETGAVFSGYNNVSIPGDSGTRFSFSEELDADPSAFYRIRVFYHFNRRHHLGALFAPLTLTSTGNLNRDLLFEDVTFPAGAPLEGTYQFNSYRLVYRYDFLRNEKLEIGVGFTAKIRDAKIAVQSNGEVSEKTNVGFVPIVHFRLYWHFADKLGLLVDGDALAAPQGRAEDVLAALTFSATDQLDIKLGYRILEGGADNDEVYNFTLVNYASVGLILQL
ncbi:MAG: hypothetical protein AB8G77_28260 [Rhodothermales bacterium]